MHACACIYNSIHFSDPYPGDPTARTCWGRPRRWPSPWSCRRRSSAAGSTWWAPRLSGGTWTPAASSPPSTLPLQLLLLLLLLTLPYYSDRSTDRSQTQHVQVQGKKSPNPSLLNCAERNKSFRFLVALELKKTAGNYNGLKNEMVLTRKGLICC